MTIVEKIQMSASGTDDSAAGCSSRSSSHASVPDNLETESKLTADDLAFNAWLIPAHNRFVTMQNLWERTEEPSAELLAHVEAALLDLQEKLDQQKCQHHDLSFQKIVLSAVLKYELGRVIVKRSENIARRLFMKAWEIVEEHALHRNCILLSFSILENILLLVTTPEWVDQMPYYYGKQKAISAAMTMEGLIFNYTKMFADLFISKAPTPRPRDQEIALQGSEKLA